MERPVPTNISSRHRYRGCSFGSSWCQDPNRQGIGKNVTAIRYDHSYEGANYEVGGWLSGLVGSGNVIAVSTWTTRAPTTAVSNAALRLVGTSRLKTIVSGPGAIVAESLDGGRIAVVRSMALWPSNSRAERRGLAAPASTRRAASCSFEVNRGTAKEAALDGDRLAILTTRNTLEPLPRENGAFIWSWPVPLRAAHLDLEGGIAIYSAYPR